MDQFRQVTMQKAFVIFHRDYRSIIKDRNPEYGFGDTTKAVIEEWNNMSETVRHQYIKLASQKKSKF